MLHLKIIFYTLKEMTAFILSYVIWCYVARQPAIFLMPIKPMYGKSFASYWLFAVSAEELRLQAEANALAEANAAAEKARIYRYVK